MGCPNSHLELYMCTVYTQIPTILVHSARLRAWVMITVINDQGHTSLYEYTHVLCTCIVQHVILNYAKGHSSYLS